MAPILVLGIGNILLRDEGVGVRIVEAMAPLELPEGVELLDGGTAGADLLDAISGRRKVIVLDAIQSDAPPGTVLRFSEQELLTREEVSLSLHELGFADALRMARQLHSAPSEVVFFGISPKDISTGLELTEEIARAVPKVIDLVLKELGLEQAASRGSG